MQTIHFQSFQLGSYLIKSGWRCLGYTFINSTRQHFFLSRSLHRSREGTLNLLNLSHGLLVAVHLLQSLGVGSQKRILLLSLLFLQHTATGGDHWETDQNIRCCQLLATQEWATLGCGLELIFQESQVAIDVAGQEGGLDLRCDNAGDGADKERRRFADGWKKERKKKTVSA